MISFTPTAMVGARIVSPHLDPPVDLFPAHPARGPRRRRGALAPADGPRRASSASSAPGCGPGCPPATGRDAGRGDHPRGDRRDRRPGDADAGAPAGRALAADRALRDRRAVQAQGPQGLRARARDDPRGGADLPHRPRDPLLPRAAEDPLPRPGQGARRAAAARRRAAHARVHDEGQLLVRPRRGGPGRAATSSHGAPTRGSSTAAGCAGTRSSPTSG